MNQDAEVALEIARVAKHKDQLLQAALDLLEKAEWAGAYCGWDSCPWCRAAQIHGMHRRSCRWLGLMHKAGRRK